MDPSIVAEVIRLLEQGEPFVLATMVDARGSTPQKVGARLLVRRDGSTAGTLGGGCVEAEAIIASMEALESGEPRLLELALNEDIAMDYGLSCGGTEVVLADPTQRGRQAIAAWRELQSAAREGRRAALVTVTRPGGGLASGGVSAVQGQAGDEISRWATELLADEQPGPRLLQLDSGAEIYVEPWVAPAEVVVAGGGHVGKAVATLAKFLGYRVAVLDDRPEFAGRERFPDADALLAGDIEQSLAEYPLTACSAVVIVTRGHKYDYQALAAALRSPAGYVGLMGSKRKVTLIYRQLLADGISVERLRDVHSPIGLDIGAVSPEEIAVSIMAEVTMWRQGGSGGAMRGDERLIQAAANRSPGGG